MTDEEEFIPLVEDNPDTWDDSALIEAYERAARSHKLAKSGTPSHSNNASKHSPQQRDESQPAESHLGESVHSNNDDNGGLAKNDAPAPQVPNPDADAPPADGHMKSRKRRHQESHVTADRPTSSSPSNPPSFMLQILPPPPALLASPPPDLEALLLSWYEAGYRAGYYAAKHMPKGPDA